MNLKNVTPDDVAVCAGLAASIAAVCTFVSAAANGYGFVVCTATAVGLLTVSSVVLTLLIAGLIVLIDKWRTYLTLAAVLLALYLLFLAVRQFIA
jgi:hypothetical protein